jgi:hypothetical protein
MSTDQYTKVLAAFDRWLPHATPGEHCDIVRFLTDATAFFVARNFRFPWRQKLIVEPNIYLHTVALYLPLLHMMAKHSDRKWLDHLRRFEEPLRLLVEAVKHPEQAPRGFDMNFNGTSLLLDGFAVAARNGSTDVRLHDVMHNSFERAAQKIDPNGFGLEHKATRNSSWVIRMVAGAPLLARDSAWEQRRQQAWRVLVAHDHIDRMRYSNNSSELDPVDGIDGCGIASWLLAYWRLQSP